jgi:hypothetical protein
MPSRAPPRHPSILYKDANQNLGCLVSLVPSWHVWIVSETTYYHNAHVSSERHAGMRCHEQNLSSSSSPLGRWVREQITPVSSVRSTLLLYILLFMRLPNLFWKVRVTYVRNPFPRASPICLWLRSTFTITQKLPSCFFKQTIGEIITLWFFFNFSV